MTHAVTVEETRYVWPGGLECVFNFEPVTTTMFTFADMAKRWNCSLESAQKIGCVYRWAEHKTPSGEPMFTGNDIEWFERIGGEHLLSGDIDAAVAVMTARMEWELL